MRILVPVHYFFPKHKAGTELYTLFLARKLKEKGHIVVIFTSEDRSEPGFELKEEEFEGFRIKRLYHSEPLDFKKKYLNPEFDLLFAKTLDEFKPDLVHFQHLFRLSAGFVKEAKKRNIPMVMTVADYFLLCPAIIMLKPGMILCNGPEKGNACARCGNAFSSLLFSDKQAGPKAYLYKALEQAIGLAHRIKRKLPPKLVQDLRQMIGREKEIEQKIKLSEERFMEMKTIADQIALFLAPSRFLKDMMINSGLISPDKIFHLDYGFETKRFKKDIKKKNNKKIRFGFIGTLVEHKGAHILISAFRKLDLLDVELFIYGDLDTFPGYSRTLKKIADKDKRIKFKGAIDNENVSNALQEIDYLVVPSLWYENSPLTIHEAFLAGVPVITTRLGGMAELVKDGISGLLFEHAETESLAQVLYKAGTDFQLLEKLKANLPEVMDIEEHYERLIYYYKKIGLNI